MSASEPRRVELQGEERERATRLREEAERALFGLSEIVFRALEVQDRDLTGLELVVRPGNYRQVIRRYVTGECMGVLEDPPGVCTTCGPND